MLVVLYVVLFVLALKGTKVNWKGFNDPMDRQLTTSIKGICIGLVFIVHLAGYVETGGYVGGGVGDTIFHVIRRIQGQLLVVMFLFYSGYGVFTAAKNRGIEYVKNMPRKRILSTLLNFDVAVLFFTVAMFIKGEEIDLGRFALSLIAWDSMGNSNWYIFAILICYVLAWIALNSVFQYRGAICLVMTILTVCALSLLKPEWWYNTMLVFPLGALYAEYRDGIERIVKRNYWRYLLLSSIALCLSIAWFLKHNAGVSYNLAAMAFAVFIVIATMKIQFGNEIIFWMGVNLFPLYIYQRLPMRVFGDVFNGHMHGLWFWFYTTISSVITLLIARCYRYIEIKLK